MFVITVKFQNEVSEGVIDVKCAVLAACALSLGSHTFIRHSPSLDYDLALLSTEVLEIHRSD